MAEAPPSIHPCLFYRDANAAITWLNETFGFETVMNVPGPEGSVAHAELRYGPAIIMVGSAGNQPESLSPRDLPGHNQSIYLYTADIRAHYDHAKAAGAEIFRDYEEPDYGGAGYSAYDLEGHQWSFGSYLPGDPSSA